MPYQDLPMTHGLGWLPDLPDHRDLRYAVHRMALEAPPAMPDTVDLRGVDMPAPYDQGHLGSCTANALAGGFAFEHLRQELGAIMPSRLFIYYGERIIEGTVRSDAGAMLRDGIKVMAKSGVPEERYWPYDITKFAVKPPATAYKAALKHKALAYFRLDHLKLEELLSCLAGGYPFVFGFTVYDSFESPAVAKSGVVELPKHGERVLGGHAVVAVGYDQKAARFLVRNSWGAAWGQGGYCTMPFAYLTNGDLADDFWTIRVVT